MPGTNRSIGANKIQAMSDIHAISPLNCCLISSALYCVCNRGRGPDQVNHNANLAYYGDKDACPMRADLNPRSLEAYITWSHLHLLYCYAEAE
jgi:hypothetical protein